MEIVSGIPNDNLWENWVVDIFFHNEIWILQKFDLK